MKPWLTSLPFLDRHKVDIDLAIAAFQSARKAREQGNNAEAARFTDIGDGMLIRLEQLYQDEVKQK